MERPSWVVALLSVLLLGCGQSDPPAPGPAPAFQPPANAAAPPDEKAQEQPGAPAGQGVVSEEMPAEEKEEMTVEEAPAEKSAEAPADEAAAKDGPLAEGAVAGEDTPPAAPAKAKGTGGKLLRGLGSSFSRALSKASTGSAASDERRAAPKLEDDPFPKGAPTDDKPNE